MAGVYISYPFCTQKCTFCNFASDVHSWDIRERYETALLDELSGHQWLWQPETVYFGGGTPSLMPPDFLRKLMAAIPGGCLREVTLECAPGTLSRDSIRDWLACGVDRVSLGVQSFVTEELRQTGRRHTAATVEADLQLLRESGLLNVNIDLIAGLPGQTQKSWGQSLDWIERFAPPHVSVYIFEIDEESRLGNEIILGGERYGANRVPDDGLVAELYERAVARLNNFGIERYEISNFARTGWESLHNLKYWKLEPYAGFGLDAHSFDGAHRWSNPDRLDAYVGERQIECTASDRGEEHFFVGLRLMEGIEPTADEWTRFEQPIQKWVRAGMLQKDDSRLRLSPRAVLISNEIFQDFL
ncbi:MAG TPA: coproporphyrinogen-III oxidase family protein [Bryobacteraceae bacterium]|nr:coproporphyrinogen-III oxidase family protein [Bryobacteraceae bacterium]